VRENTTTTTKGTIMTTTTKTPEKQMLTDGSLVPTRPHVDDVVGCVDGSECRHGDAIFDCEGEAHRTDEDRHDRNVEIVEDFLNTCGKWAEEYCTENEDYADGYSCIVDEDHHGWAARVREWIENEYGDTYGSTPFDDYIENVVAKVCEELDGSSECDLEFSHNEYAAYSGSGCCLNSFAIDEYEDQIEINEHDVLRVLHEEGGLDDVLDDVNCDVYVSRSMKREKNEETGRYEYVGRTTYMPYEHRSEHPDLTITTGVSGRWHFVVPADRMNELVCEALLECNGYDE
jgi:hypothetical protein